MSQHPFDLSGRAALVTGSTGGIGRAIAVCFAAAGAHVVVHGKEDDADAAETLRTCQSFGVRAALVTADLTGPSKPLADDIFRRALELEPGIDILVNHAGGHQGEGAFEHVPAELLERTLRINVMFPWLLAQCFARHWLEHGRRGRMLFTGSVNGRLAEAHSAAYDTAKGAVEMMVRTLCVALAPRGIRVNGLAPGIVHAPRTAWLKQQPRLAEWIRHHIPDGRIPDAGHLAHAALFLVSDAAEYVHGHMLVIDGGISALQIPEPVPAPQSGG